jgi:hypothetical protein
MADKNQYLIQAMLNLLLYVGDSVKKNPAVEKVKDLLYNKPVPKRKRVSREEIIARKMNFISGANPVTDYGRYKAPMGG